MLVCSCMSVCGGLCLSVSLSVLIVSAACVGAHGQLEQSHPATTVGSLSLSDSVCVHIQRHRQKPLHTPYSMYLN